MLAEIRRLSLPDSHKATEAARNGAGKWWGTGHGEPWMKPVGRAGRYRSWMEQRSRLALSRGQNSWGPGTREETLLARPSWCGYPRALASPPPRPAAGARGCVLSPVGEWGSSWEALTPS